MSIFKRKDPAAMDTQGQIIDNLVSKIKELDDEGLTMLFKALGIPENKAEDTAEIAEESAAIVESETTEQAEDSSEGASIPDEVKGEDTVEDSEDKGETGQEAQTIEKSEDATLEDSTVLISGPSSIDPEQVEAEVNSESVTEQAPNEPGIDPEQVDVVTDDASKDAQADTINALLARIDSLEVQLKTLTESSEKVKEAEEDKQEYGGITKKSALADSAIPRNSDGSPRTKEEWRKMYEHG